MSSPKSPAIIQWIKKLNNKNDSYSGFSDGVSSSEYHGGNITAPKGPQSKAP